MAKDTGKDKKRFFSTSVDIPAGKRKDLINILNQALADTLDLYNDTKQAHWNVKGENFYMLHELFDDLAEGVEGYVDTIAERITALGGYAYGTTRAAAERSRLEEYPYEATEGKEHLNALISRYARYANGIRKEIDESAGLGDAGTADLFTEISRFADKSLWFLEAHLQDQER